MLPRTRKSHLGPTSGLRDWWKIIAMGALLAGLVYVAFIHEPGGTDGLGLSKPIVEVEVSVPEIDREILQQAHDKTRQERLILEAAPLAHLLEKSLQVVPTVAKALGAQTESVDIARLRSNPDAYRGAYLGFAGRLRHLSSGKSGHPVKGYKIYEGWIETDDGEVVLFRVSLPPKDVEVGGYVRVEGFFLKLRDSHGQPEATEAPLLVGPEIIPDYEPWQPVRELDPTVLAEIHDDEIESGTNANGRVIELHGMRADLPSSQSVPLWHLASHCLLVHGGEEGLAEWRKVPALVRPEQFADIREGRIERGQRMRILGTFVLAHTFAARPNPIGVEHWTQAWIQVRLGGGKLIPIWIPGRIGGYRRGDSIEVRGHYFGRLIYDTEEGTAMAPVFVSAALDRYVQTGLDPISDFVKWLFAAFVLFVILLFFWISRRDRLQRDRHEVEMIERRRRRLAKTAAAREQTEQQA
jgi:hypothetical protein